MYKIHGIRRFADATIYMYKITAFISKYGNIQAMQNVAIDIKKKAVKTSFNGDAENMVTPVVKSDM